MGFESAYRVPLAAVESELREKGSRFLALVEPVAEEAVARARIKEIQRRYKEASHVCWAWRIGAVPVEGRSDAGEPAGTAGAPMLQILRGAGLCDVLAVVVRWFGGVKLGKGGLARAYAGAVRQALELLEVGERLARERLQISLPYDRMGDVRRLLRPPRVELVEEAYDEVVTLTLAVELGSLPEVEEALAAFAEVRRNAGV